MKRTNFDQLINENMEEAQKVLEFIGKHDDKSGDTLSVRKTNGYTRYYKRCSPKDTTGVYLGDDKKDEVERLEYGYYYKKLRAAAESNVAIYEKIKNETGQLADLDKVYWDIPEEKRHLIEPYHEEVDEDFAKKWSTSIKKRRIVESEMPYVASNGVRVRSKSELIIAERFIAAGVPFYYEVPTTIDHFEVWFPDFYVLNKRTKQMYFWEHFGMMGDPKYSALVQHKIEAYARNQIYLGRDLLISMESAEHPLDTEYIDEIIKQFLL